MYTVATLVTVRKAFCPDVTFTVNLYKKGDAGDRLSKVLDIWRQITGLSWHHTPKILEDSPEFEAATVVNPIDNCGRVTFFWKKPE